MIPEEDSPLGRDVVISTQRVFAQKQTSYSRFFRYNA